MLAQAIPSVVRSRVITEVKTTLTGERQEFVCRLVDRSANHVVVVYPVTRKGGRRVGALHIPQGTESYGYFWRDRLYNVYHWVTPAGRTLGYYVNLADSVELRPTEVRWRDLAVDLLFSADGGSVQILDEHEIAGHPTELQAKISAAQKHVLTHRDDLLAEVRRSTMHFRRRSPHRRLHRGIGSRATKSDT